MLHLGNVFKDDRGTISFNNEFDTSKIKRIYTIENHSTDFIRGWQGHKIESRWFACMKGEFKIGVIEVDNFEEPNKNLEVKYHIMKEGNLDFLEIKPGHITSIQAMMKESKLLVLSDYALGEIQDEYRFPLDYFKY